MNINDTLSQRSTTHGDFGTNSRISQRLKNIFRDSPNNTFMTSYEREALDMIVHKMARILCGNPHELDHWHDIAGYATLVCKEIQQEQQQ